MMGEAPRESKNFPSMLHLYVEDVDAIYQRAMQPAQNRFASPPISPTATAPGASRMPSAISGGFPRTLKMS